MELIDHNSEQQNFIAFVVHEI